MSKDMLTVPRDLLQDLIDDVADYAVSRTFKDRETTWRSDLLDRARALLARQPAAIDKQEAAMRDRARRFLSEFVRQTGISMSDHVQEVMLNLFLRYAAPLDKSESDALTALSTQNPIYAYEWDHSPGVVHRSFSNAPYNGRQPDRTLSLYAAPLATEASKPAPSVEQDERGAKSEKLAAFEKWFSEHRDDDFGCGLSKRSAWIIWDGMWQARAELTSTNLASGD
jgi:hypothetical protein